NKNVIIRLLDVSDLDSVRKFAKETLENEERLDVLINNAGAGVPSRQESKQGFELTYATNHLGHFLLTNLLLGLLRKSGPSRVVNVSSMGHRWDFLDMDDLHYKNRTYNWFKAYCQSKFLNILFTKELAHYMAGKGMYELRVIIIIIVTIVRSVWEMNAKISSELEVQLTGLL
ncbi:UNVERIFIED_CONTAM: hypothetical protein GTU68_008742, partial [Idotea baltica]|nr:hypothetical protein [Idotea baltica]